MDKEQRNSKTHDLLGAILEGKRAEGKALFADLINDAIERKLKKRLFGIEDDA